MFMDGMDVVTGRKACSNIASLGMPRLSESRTAYPRGRTM